MTEGKLYKKAAKVIAENGYRYTHDFITKDEMAHAILDEARRKFPADDHGLDVAKVMPWFLEQFGDEP